MDVAYRLVSEYILFCNLSSPFHHLLLISAQSNVLLLQILSYFCTNLHGLCWKPLLYKRDFGEGLHLLFSIPNGLLSLEDDPNDWTYILHNYLLSYLFTLLFHFLLWTFYNDFQIVNLFTKVGSFYLCNSHYLVIVLQAFWYSVCRVYHSYQRHHFFPLCWKPYFQGVISRRLLALRRNLSFKVLNPKSYKFNLLLLHSSYLSIFLLKICLL